MPPDSAALPYVTILSPLRPGGAWGYACNVCSKGWRAFVDEPTAKEFAAMHAEVRHDA